MEIDVLSRNIKLNSALRVFIKEKIGQLEKFLTAEKKKTKVRVEVTKTSLHHKKGKVFWAEIHLRFPGKVFLAKAADQDLRSAINQAKEEIQRRLKGHGPKIAAKNKREQRKFKVATRLSFLARFFRKGRIRDEGM